MSSNANTLVGPAVYLVNDYLLKPDGTEFIIERRMTWHPCACSMAR